MHQVKSPTEELETWWVGAYPKLLSTVTRWTTSRDLAEDILQDLAVLALGAQEDERFHDLASFTRWAYRNARWLFLNHLRRSTPKRAPAEEWEEHLTAQAPTQERQAETRSWLSEALRQLPARQRAVTTASMLGFTTREIAENLDISVATVRSLRRFARNRLAAFLKEQEGDDRPPTDTERGEPI